MVARMMQGMRKAGCRWTCLDTFLLVVAAVAFLISIVCAVTLLPRWRPDPEKHKGGDPRYHHTKCRVDNLEDKGEVSCSKENGEWCEREERDRRDAHSSEERDGDHHGDDEKDKDGRRTPGGDDKDHDDDDDKHDRNGEPGMERDGDRDSGGQGTSWHHTRSFPCFEVHVSYERRGGRHRGRLHATFREAENFPRCAEASCEEWWTDNERNIQNKKKRWEEHKEKGEEFECYYNENDEDEVLEEEPCFWHLVRWPAFHLVLWTAILALVCLWIIIIRRLCFLCKTVYHEEHKIDIAKTDAFIATALKNYGVDEGKKGTTASDGMPEVDTVKSSVFTTGATAPPAYTEKAMMGQMIAVPPAYEAVIRPTENTYEFEERKVALV